MAILELITVVLGLVSLGHVSDAVTPTVTGTFKPTLPGKCYISMKSFGWEDTGANMVKSSYIKVNGLTYFDSFDGNSAYRGFDVVTLDTNTCRASNFAAFDTSASAAPGDALASWINDVPDGTHILGVTSDDGFWALSESAKAALRSIGVDTTGRVHADKLIFHAIKGKPDKAITKVGKAKEENIFYEDNASPCDLCQNNGVLKVNSAGTGFECQCLKIYSGLYCEKFSEAGCLEHYTQTESSLTPKKRYLK